MMIGDFATLSAYSGFGIVVPFKYPEPFLTVAVKRRSPRCVNDMWSLAIVTVNSCLEVKWRTASRLFCKAGTCRTRENRTL